MKKNILKCVIVLITIFVSSCDSDEQKYMGKAPWTNEPMKEPTNWRYEQAKNTFFAKGSQTTDSSWYYRPSEKISGTFYIKTRTIVLFHRDKKYAHTIFIDSFKTSANSWYADKNGDENMRTNVPISDIDRMLKDFE